MKSYTVKIEELFQLKIGKNEGNGFFDQTKELMIPLYQREYKWEQNKITTLISDIQSRDKFLGIIILDDTNQGYEIVDGQQRITTIYLILIYLYNRNKGKQREQQALVKYIKKGSGDFVLQNESIGNYITEEGNELIIDIKTEKDYYYQNASFKKANDIIKKELDPIDLNGLKEFKDKLINSEVVVIINDQHNSAHSVEQIFLDINEKSHILDEEDIFKGHCFRIFKDANPSDLRNYWIKVKKCGADFVEFFHYKDFNTFLYHFLLFIKSPNVNTKLWLDGKHILVGKDMDEVEELLQQMIDYGQKNIEFYKKLKSVDYKFADICNNSMTNNETQKHAILKSIIRKLFELNVQYPKLPLFFFIWELKSTPAFVSCITYDQLKTVFTNLFISGMLFSFLSTRKGKDSIDYSLKKSFESKPDTIQAIVTASNKMRNEQVKNYEIPAEKCNTEMTQLYSAVIDHYDPIKRCLISDYYSGNYNLEHLVMPDDTKCRIIWVLNDNKTIVFSIDKNNAKKYKKLLGNYVFLDKNLNQELHNYDIIYKIDHINAWFLSRVHLPHKYLDMIFENIENKPSYNVLKNLKKIEMNDPEIIKEAYYSFLDEYFSDDNQHALSTMIKDSFLKSFQNN